MGTGETAAPPRRRDAAKTRQLLLDAAIQRFTRDGYAATTVRDIADDAGVNVALISRYFRSKEGLFEACLTSGVDEIRSTADDEVPLSRVPEAIARQIAGPCAHGLPHHLVLLLRSSGDESADRIRRDLLRAHSERLAAVTGDTGDPGMLLRAQIVLAAAAGIALLRTKAGMEPLAAATEEDLVPPLRDLVQGLLTVRPAGHPTAAASSRAHDGA